jgi:hypothetical protein
MEFRKVGKFSGIFLRPLEGEKKTRGMGGKGATTNREKLDHFLHFNCSEATFDDTFAADN